MSIRESIADFARSIRGIFEDRREAQAVNLAKLEFRARIHMFRIFIDEHDIDKYNQLGMLEIEIDAATKKEDIERLVLKLSKIMGVEYPE